jgi:hypothetical protein
VLSGFTFAEFQEACPCTDLVFRRRFTFWLPEVKRLNAESTVPVLRKLVRQFDSVGVFPITLVLLSKHLFQPLCLFAATHLSTDLGLWPMKNSSPQPSHLSVPSLGSLLVSLLLFFIATAYIF